MRKLGNTQIEVLRSFYCSGRFPGGGWYWVNYSTTMRITQSLVKRGLVEPFVHKYFAPGWKQHAGREMTLDSFRITPAGIAVVREHFPNVDMFYRPVGALAELDLLLHSEGV